MKKLLLILFIIPAFLYGQDVPLTEKKVTTESMENKERKLKEKADDKVRKENTKRTKKYNRSLAMQPKNQIGYITNFTSHPWGGLNFFNHYSPRMGFYIDWRPALNSIHGANFTNQYDGDENITKYGETLWTSVTNLGISFRISNSRDAAFMIYGGIGRSTQKTFMARYDEYNVLLSDWWYYEDGGVNINTNFNFGILRQTSSVVSWQLGFDSAVPGINFGMGFTWD